MLCATLRRVEREIDDGPARRAHRTPVPTVCTVYRWFAHRVVYYRITLAPLGGSFALVPRERVYNLLRVLNLSVDLHLASTRRRASYLRLPYTVPSRLLIGLSDMTI